MSKLSIIDEDLLAQINKGMPSVQSLTDPRVFCRTYLEEQGISFNVRREMVGTVQNIQDVATAIEVEHELRASAIRTLTRAKIPTLPYSRVIRIMAGLIDEAWRRGVQQLSDEVQCESENLEPLKAVVRMLCGQDDPVVVSVFAQFMCNVKRSLKGLNTEREMFLILYGKSGSGKSTAVLKMCSIFKHLQVSHSILHCCDPRNHAALATNVIVFDDELKAISKADASQIKNLITSKELSYRPLYTNTTVTVKRMANFIGTTNRNLIQLFSDSTGMRRFFEVTTLPNLDWALVNQLLEGDNLRTLWRGIRDDDPTRYYDEGAQNIEERQQELVSENPLESFLSDKDLVPMLENPTTWIALDALWVEWQVWNLATQNAPNWSRDYFGRVLSSVAAKRRTRDDGERVRQFGFASDPLIKLPGGA